jgi:hypothetical protein
MMGTVVYPFPGLVFDMYSTAETCHVMSSNASLSLPGSCRTLPSIDSDIIRLVLAIVRKCFDRRLCVSYVGTFTFFFYLNLDYIKLSSS